MRGRRLRIPEERVDRWAAILDLAIDRWSSIVFSRSPPKLSKSTDSDFECIEGQHLDSREKRGAWENPVEKGENPDGEIPPSDVRRRRRFLTRSNY